MYVILCLGTRPVVYGPFEDEGQADWWLDDHGVNPVNGNWDHCLNGLTPDDHHIEVMEKVVIIRREVTEYTN